MTEAIVRSVVEKLGDLITKEAKLLGGVGGQVKRVQTELINIRCYLASADSIRRKGDAESKLVENWLNQLREVAYRIEDATDTFYVELEDKQLQDTISPQKNCFYYFYGKLKNLGRKFMKVPGLHKLGTELADIQKELEEIFKSKDRYGITPLPDEAGRGSKPVIDVVMPKRRAAFQDVDETEVVGLDADRDNILKLLLNSEETPRRAVITIVGPGGLGKTTLARLIYKRVKANFDYHTILSVSQQFSLIDLLTKILEEVVDLIKKLNDAGPEKKKVLELINKSEGYELKKRDLGGLISMLKILLSGMRFLIILDDVWEVQLWDQLKDALPDDKNGNRVLITSRSIDVAKSADPIMKPYELALLNDEKSRDLLLKKALQCQEPNKVEYSSDILELANKLSKKCKGLPLALVVLGGILSTRDQTYHDWKKVLDTMNWHEEGKDCMNVLTMSYDDMPYYLKACFMYIASFPEDYNIHARNLIRMWVAEGFIPQNEKKTMEDAAEVFLEQLYQRSMVQVSSRHPDGSIKHCRVHDLLRDLAMYEAGKVNFVTVFPKLPKGSHPVGVTRRASLQVQSADDWREFINYVGPNIRSFLWFDQDRDRDLINSIFIKMVEFRLLRVVEIDLARNVCRLRGLDGLVHLKYLAIRNCPNLEFSSDFSWGRLKNLETLDLQTVKECDEPIGLWTIGALRHVISDYFSFNRLPASANLRNLQTLEWISISCVMAWPKNQLPILNNLRKLSLICDKEETAGSEHWERVGHLLATLPYMLSLRISILFGIHYSFPKEIVYPRGLPNYENLETLLLEGPWASNVTLEASLFPPHLIKLTLDNSQLGDDPMPELGKLKSLKKLVLEDRVYVGGKEMICPAGFPALQTLYLYLDDTEYFTVMEGVMPKLKHLKRRYDVKLNMPPELKHFETRY